MCDRVAMHTADYEIATAKATVYPGAVAVAKSFALQSCEAQSQVVKAAMLR